MPTTATDFEYNDVVNLLDEKRRVRSILNLSFMSRISHLMKLAEGTSETSVEALIFDIPVCQITNIYSVFLFRTISTTHSMTLFPTRNIGTGIRLYTTFNYPGVGY